MNSPQDIEFNATTIPSAIAKLLADRGIGVPTIYCQTRPNNKRRHWSRNISDHPVDAIEVLDDRATVDACPRRVKLLILEVLQVEVGETCAVERAVIEAEVGSVAHEKVCVARRRLDHQHDQNADRYEIRTLESHEWFFVEWGLRRRAYKRSELQTGASKHKSGNDRHQRMAGQDFPCQHANYRHSAAWLCSPDLL